jgi:hypothetical protein
MDPRNGFCLHVPFDVCYRLLWTYDVTAPDKPIGKHVKSSRPTGGDLVLLKIAKQ